MAKFVEPRVFMLGKLEADVKALASYLDYTDQSAFMEQWEAAEGQLPSGAALCSFFGKLCYKSLVPDGRNANITKTRDIENNFKGILSSAHGSVLEHFSVSFVVTNCSRVATHEIVRHRVGMAISQTSGRYCRIDDIDFVSDPVLGPYEDLVSSHIRDTETVIYTLECRLGLRKAPNIYPNSTYYQCFMDPENATTGTDAWKTSKYRWVPDNSLDFAKRKAITSALRRLAPNGQANEIGLTFNLRSLRHFVMVRTAPAAEREIRMIAGQMYELVKREYPLIVCDAVETMHEGLLSVSGMRMQPYERDLSDYSSDELNAELARRQAK